MNYTLHYDRLMLKASTRDLPSTVYTETHHIIPRCMGGTDASVNLIRLTPEEHFLAHQLLVKMHPENVNLICAAHLMCYGNNGTRMHNKSFGWIKRKLALVTSERFKIVNKRPQQTAECPHCGKVGGVNALQRYHFERCTYHPDSAQRQHNLTSRVGKPQSDATKAKRKATQRDNPPHRGKQHSAETKERLREIKLRPDNPRRGIKAGPQPVVTCPHCAKTGGKNNMVKHHFDKCRMKDAAK